MQIVKDIGIDAHCTQQWHLLMTKLAQEEIAVAHLKRQGLRSLLSTSVAEIYTSWKVV